MITAMRWAAITAVLLLCSCGREEPRIRGDAGGIPMTFVVTRTPDAIDALARQGGFVRQIVVERDYWGDPWCSPWGPHHLHPPLGERAYQPSTRTYLLIGNGPAQAQYLRMPLSDLSQEAVVPIAAGKTVTISVQSSGGYEGWREIGAVTADAAQTRITITLDRDGAHVSPLSAAPGNP